MVLLFVVLGWIALSIPVGILTGMVIRRGQGPIPDDLIELPSDDLARASAGTRG